MCFASMHHDVSEIPFEVAAKALKTQIMSRLFKQGKSLQEVIAIVDSPLYEKTLVEVLQEQHQVS